MKKITKNVITNMKRTSYGSLERVLSISILVKLVLITLLRGGGAGEGGVGRPVCGLL